MRSEEEIRKQYLKLKEYDDQIPLIQGADKKLTGMLVFARWVLNDKGEK